MDGQFIHGVQTSNLVSGLTDTNGEFEVTYDPPLLGAGDLGRTVLIYAWATYAGFSPSKNATETITVHPPGETFLSLVTELPEGNLVVEGGSIPVGIQVTDEDHNPIAGVDVTIDSNPSATISPGSGITDATGFVNGQQNVIFTAPQVTMDTYHVITVTATKLGYDQAVESLFMIVKDNQRPDVLITSPTSGQTVSGVVNVSGSASDPDGDSELARVEVKVDGGNWETATGTTSWSFDLDTTSLSDDTHAIYARSYDGLEYSIVTSVVVTVENNDPPSITEISVYPGQTLSGAVVISGKASDPDGDDDITRVVIRIDNGLWQNGTGTVDWNFPLYTSDLDDGPHILGFMAYDGDVNSTLVEVPIYVENDVTTDCPDGTECGGLASVLGWLGIIALFVVLFIIAFMVLVKSIRKQEPEEAPDDVDADEESPSSSPEEEHKD
jgi:predicted secreted protein